MESARDRSGIPRDFPQGKPVELERIARFPARRAGNAPKRRGDKIMAKKVFITGSNKGIGKQI
jgi:hypothetical protein